MPRVTLRTSSKVKRSKVKVTRPLWAPVQVAACRKRGHITAAALRDAQLVQTALDILITHILDAVGNVVGNFYGRMLLVAGK